jgi:hypothetical protein
MFKIKPTVTAKYAILDLGNMLLELGIRQGIFGHTDLDHSLGPDGVSFKCEAV